MKKEYLFFIAVWIPLFVYLLISISTQDTMNDGKTIIDAVTIDSKSPAGEINKGFELKQIINVEQKAIDQTPALRKKTPLCFDVLMATYGKRANSGTIEFIFKNSTLSDQLKVDVSTIKDNLEYKVCFRNFMLSNIQSGKHELIIKGINSPPGAGVTVWLTNDISRGYVSINNKSVNKGLIFSVSTQAASASPIIITFLVFFALVSSAILIYRLVHKLNNMIELNNLKIEQTTLYKGLAIFLIAMHNYFHWIGPKPGENEFDFKLMRFESYIDILSTQTVFGLQATFSYFGHYGVQIFLFLSAYGLTKKYKNTHPQYFDFVWTRIIKIYPAFLLAIVLWAIFTGYKAGWYGPMDIMIENWKALVYKLTFVSNFIPGEELNLVGPWWFVSLIVQFYIFFPVLLMIEKKFGTKGLLTISLLSIICSPFIQKLTDFNVYYTLIGHLAEFCLGIYLAKREKNYIHFYLIVILALFFLLGNMFKLFWYFSDISVLLLMILLFQWITNKMGHYTYLFFSFIGAISMYIFYTNGFIRSAFALAAFRSGNWFEILQYGVGFFSTVILFSSLLYWLEKHLVYSKIKCFCK